MGFFLKKGSDSLFFSESGNFLGSGGYNNIFIVGHAFHGFRSAKFLGSIFCFLIGRIESEDFFPENAGRAKILLSFKKLSKVLEYF